MSGASKHNSERGIDAAVIRGRGAMLAGLLVDRTYDKEGYADAVARAGICLERPHFRIAILSWNCEKDELFQNIDQLELLAKDVIPSAQVYVFFHDINLVLLLNYDVSGAEAVDVLSRELHEYIEQARLQMEMEFTVCLGCEVFGVREIPCSYRSAMSSWEQSLAYDIVDPLVINERNLARQDNMAYLDELQLMINYLLAGEYINAVHIQSRVFEHHARNKKPYLTVINDRMTFFRSTFLHAVEAAITNNPEAIEAYLMCRNMLNVPDPDALTLKELRGIYFSIAQIAEDAQEQQHNRVLVLAGKIRDYINEHFSDPDLDTTKLAGIMNISTSYLHRLFKGAYNQTVLAYITNCRISEAKRLLRETNIRTKDIASMVGYSSSVTFYRAFQKSCSISPDSFRRTEA